MPGIAEQVKALLPQRPRRLAALRGPGGGSAGGRRRRGLKPAELFADFYRSKQKADPPARAPDPLRHGPRGGPLPRGGRGPHASEAAAPGDRGLHFLPREGGARLREPRPLRDHRAHGCGQVLADRRPGLRPLRPGPARGQGVPPAPEPRVRARQRAPRFRGGERALPGGADDPRGRALPPRGSSGCTPAPRRGPRPWPTG